MGNQKFDQIIILLLNLGTLLISLACPTCPYPTPPNHPPLMKPPHHPRSPVAKPPPPTPYNPKPPVTEPPVIPKPPVVNPPVIPTPPVVYPPPETPCSPPPSPPTCPIDTLKLSACVDVLGGLVHVGTGQSAEEACCPVLEGVVGVDAAICLCTTIKARVLNFNILIPIALQVLVDCGKDPPSGFKCPA